MRSTHASSVEFRKDTVPEGHGLQQARVDHISRFPRDPLPKFLGHYRRIPYKQLALRHHRAVRPGGQELLLEFC